MTAALPELSVSGVPLPRGTRFIDLTGRVFGRLTVRAYAGKIFGASKPAAWLCDCSCGKTCVPVRGMCLRNGHTASCGCLQREDLGLRRRALGNVARTYPAEYQAWLSMRRRCEDPKHRSYSRYGGRGIRVCSEWGSFKTFLRDMGRRPSGLSLERQNNNGDYTPGNCVWASARTQARNRSNNINLTFRGRSQCLSAWAAECGLRSDTLAARLRRGWALQAALQTPTDR